MVEEFYGKVSRSGSNLTDNLEDKLTGDFFGTLRYIDFYDGLKRILIDALSKSVKSQELDFQNALGIIQQISCTNIMDKDNIEFWPNHELGELDVLLKFDNCYIGVEVKLHSGLSSDDQLIREAKIICDRAGDKEKILLFIAGQESCISVYNQYRNKVKGAYFIFISWEDILQSLKEVKTKCNVYWQGLILGDLIKLLTRKGFDIFSSVIKNVPNKSIDKGGYYRMSDNKMDYTENYKNAARVIFMTYQNIQKLLEATKNESENSSVGYTYMSQPKPSMTKGIVNDFWQIFSEGNNTNGSYTSLYAVNIFLTDTKEENSSDPILRVIRYVSSTSISGNIGGNDLANIFDKNSDNKVLNVEFKGLNGADINLHKKVVDIPNEHNVERLYYVDLPLMSITKYNIHVIFDAFNKLSGISD